jgi:hypothetical protein
VNRPAAGRRLWTIADYSIKASSKQIDLWMAFDRGLGRRFRGQNTNCRDNTTR